MDSLPKFRCLSVRRTVVSHLKLPHFLFGSDVGDGGGAWGTDSLLSQSQPGVQVGVFLHELVPEDPPPLQPGNTQRRTSDYRNVLKVSQTIYELIFGNI